MHYYHAPKTLFNIFLLIISMFFFSCNQKENTASSEKPEDNRFTKVVLTQGLDEPMAMTFLNDGRVLIVERKGALKAFDTKTNQINTITLIPVNTKYTSKEGVVSEAEEGLVGIVAHPDFVKNHWIYMYYADPTDTKHVAIQAAEWYLICRAICISLLATILQILCRALHRMMKDREGAVGMISVVQEIQMICAEKFCAYILKMTALTQFRKEIYFPKEHAEHVLKFL